MKRNKAVIAIFLGLIVASIIGLVVVTINQQPEIPKTHEAKGNEKEPDAEGKIGVVNTDEANKEDNGVLDEDINGDGLPDTATTVTHNYLSI
ncbi:MAG: hypothetical protein LBD38_00445, partial [Streptococcaceae bacterium]|nr:hypothetical protein [Streptococcaceae bacterium]